ncbi:hypothetical protein [Ralstonia phage RSP15]|uniref:hypothetical protein n=1 Tax=Ralstonia phage RSP15 TaxID=1785960 RepID=UPI00074D38C5|nr:hypothetical protein BH754_gp127 [Ralstonia phage RSP15]BAU40179.1 hypothetical protein [Ralstonia phage RSP15]
MRNVTFTGDGLHWLRNEIQSMISEFLHYYTHCKEQIEELAEKEYQRREKEMSEYWSEYSVWCLEKSKFDMALELWRRKYELLFWTRKKHPRPVFTLPAPVLPRNAETEQDYWGGNTYDKYCLPIVRDGKTVSVVRLYRHHEFMDNTNYVLDLSKKLMDIVRLLQFGICGGVTLTEDDVNIITTARELRKKITEKKHADA